MMHLFFNIFFQLRIGFGMEKQFGKKKFILLYLMCGIIGNMISVAVDPFKLAVGASTAGFGLIGVWMAEILLSWNVMGPNRDRTLVWILFMLSSVIMMSSVAANIDIFGHLGGALAGFLGAILISSMPERHKPEWYGKARALAATGLGSIVLLSAIKIFLLTPHVGSVTQCPPLTELLKGLIQRA
jgi:membrane associated rhomboid family serine protease